MRSEEQDYETLMQEVHEAELAVTKARDGLELANMKLRWVRIGMKVAERRLRSYDWGYDYGGAKCGANSAFSS